MSRERGGQGRQQSKVSTHTYLAAAELMGLGLGLGAPNAPASPASPAPEPVFGKPAPAPPAPAVVASSSPPSAAALDSPSAAVTCDTDTSEFVRISPAIRRIAGLGTGESTAATDLAMVDAEPAVPSRARGVTVCPSPVDGASPASTTGDGTVSTCGDEGATLGEERKLPLPTLSLPRRRDDDVEAGLSAERPGPAVTGARVTPPVALRAGEASVEPPSFHASGALGLFLALRN